MRINYILIQALKIKSPEFRANYAKVKKLEADYDISDARRDAYFERFRVPLKKQHQK